MVYLDNAATTHYKPRQVVETALECMTNSYSFNRSGHSGATALAVKVATVRQKIADFVGAKEPNNVIFCSSCTHALNLGILGRVKRGGHIISTVCEHNSVLRPLHQLSAQKLAEITLVSPQNGIVTAKEIMKHIKENTNMVIMQYVSNVTGQAHEIEQTGKMLSEINIDFAVDGAQAIGYLPVDMAKQKISLLAFPFHKGLHGLQGMGALVFNGKCAPNPIMFGGTGSDSANLSQPLFSPDRYEVGTLNAAGILSCGAAIDWFCATRHVTLSKIYDLCDMLHKGLTTISGVTTYSEVNASGIVSFSIDGIDSGEVSDLLNTEYGIATRSGLHCAPLMHKYLGTFDGGLVRASLSGENTKNDCYALLSAVAQISKSKGNK